MNLTKEKKIGLLGTLLVQIMFFILLLLLGFHTPLPLPEEEGILVNFGNSETGLGETEPEIQEPKQIQPEPVEQTNDEQVMTQDIDDAPEMKEETNPKKKKKIEEKEETKPEKKPEEQRKINPNVLFPPTNNTNNSTSQGIAGGKGNQGRPDGSKKSNNYTGYGQGNSGISFSLRGRRPKGLPKPKYTGNNEGKVVVEITVDRNGNVTSATPGVKGTTTTAAELWQAAKIAALKTKFDKSETAPSIQQGTITYIFVLH